VDNDNSVAQFMSFDCRSRNGIDLRAAMPLKRFKIISRRVTASYPEHPIAPAEGWRVSTAGGIWPAGRLADTLSHRPSSAMRHRKKSRHVTSRNSCRIYGLYLWCLL